MPDPQLPLLVLTPHSSGALPASVLYQMLGDEMFETAAREALLRRLFLDGDPYTDLIFHVPGARQLNAPWSRFVVDLNRERGDGEDNGVVKRVGFDRSPLYPPGVQPAEEERLRRHWDSFDLQVRAELEGARLLLVGHCMAAVGPALGPDSGKPRPALTLMVGEGGQETFPAPLVGDLQAAAERAFAPVLEAAGLVEAEREGGEGRVAVNDPWATDTLSLRHHAGGGSPAFGLEINAGLYLDAGGQPREGRLLELNRATGAFARAALELLG
ncbi:MAG: N-formylglutamate amidohydrolase [Deinococcus sp.]